VSLNIKNDRVHQLAREAAARTGQSQTAAIEAALRRYLDALDREESDDDRWRRVDEILTDMRTRLAAIPGGLELSTDILYDAETGLPA
jgi:antitoxin VapB